MTTRRRNLVLLAAVLAAAGVAAYFALPPLSQKPAAEAIPAGAFLIATLDLVAIRSSPLEHELAELKDVSDVSQRCGFDPLARAKTVAIGVPEKPDGVFGIAITHDLGESELSDCAERVMAARGSSGHVDKRNGWVLLEQEAVAEALSPKGTIAYRKGSPLLVGRGDYVGEMQRAVDAKTARGISDAEHAALRTALRARAGDHPLAVITAVLPQSLRDRLKNEIEIELMASPGQNSPATMSAVLSISSVGLAASSHPGNDNIDLVAQLRCEDPSACEAVRDFIERKRQAMAADPGARFIGLGALLDALHVAVTGSVVDLSLSAPESELARVTRGLFRQNRKPAPTLPLPSAQPDETLHPKRSP